MGRQGETAAAEGVRAMRRMGMTEPFWVDGLRWEGSPWRVPQPSVATRAWKLGWGLLFVVAMTVLSEWGPPMAYSKVPPVPAADAQDVRAVK